MIGNSVEAEDNSRVSCFVCVIQKSQCVFAPGWNIMIPPASSCYIQGVIFI